MNDEYFCRKCRTVFPRPRGGFNISCFTPGCLGLLVSSSLNERLLEERVVALEAELALLRSRQPDLMTVIHAGMVHQQQTHPDQPLLIQADNMCPDGAILMAGRNVMAKVYAYFESLELAPAAGLAADVINRAAGR